MARVRSQRKVPSEAIAKIGESGSGYAIALICWDKSSKNRYFRPLKPPFGGQNHRCNKPSAHHAGMRFVFLKPFAPLHVCRVVALCFQ